MKYKNMLRIDIFFFILYLILSCISFAIYEQLSAIYLLILTLAFYIKIRFDKIERK